MNGAADKISGKTKQAVGKITNNNELEAKGKVEETKGKVKSNIQHASDQLQNRIDDIKRP